MLAIISMAFAISLILNFNQLANRQKIKRENFYLRLDNDYLKNK